MARTAAPASPVTAKPPRRATVIVASKLPMSVELQLCKPHKQMVQGRFGAAEETVYIKAGQVYIVRGTAMPAGIPPKGYDVPEMKNGAAITRGIPADFWEEWAEQNRDLSFVAAGLVFALDDDDSIRDAIKDTAGIVSGLDPLDMTGDRPDPRVPRSIEANVKTIATAEDVPGA